ncbi:MAG TPA: pilus assembly protein [Hyphomicrobiaceae bacterium]|nr:pilus assembly protein [Hyphomicrobiaceae bacterium]
MLALMSRATSFFRDRRGNVAIIFAMTTIPVAGVTGAAIDYGRAYVAHMHLQSATDAAAMAAASAANKTTGERESIAVAMFKANVAGNSAIANAVPQVTQSDGVTKVEVSAAVGTTFMRLLNVNDMLIEASTTVQTAGKKLELALMFDVTGSMNDTTSTGNSKIVDAKAAALDLLDIMLPETGLATRRIALIPFASKVKVPADVAAAATGSPATKTESSTKSTTTTTWSLSSTDFDWLKLSSCEDRLKDYYDDHGGMSSSAAQTKAEDECASFTKSKIDNKWRYKTPEVVSTSTTTTTTTYTDKYINPCMIERLGSAPSRYEDDAPGTGFTAVYSTTKTADVSCPPSTTLIPLTSDRTLLSNTISALTTGSSTAGHLGTAWSYYSISPNWSSAFPVESAPVAYDDTGTIKAAILMTDGEYNTTHCGTSCASASEQAIAICTEMKGRGIQVWTIGFGMSTNPSDPARQTLVECADPGRYFFPYNGDELRAVFATIGQSLTDTVTKPRIVR